jgi:hypothetical protein
LFETASNRRAAARVAPPRQHARQPAPAAPSSFVDIGGSVAYLASASPCRRCRSHRPRPGHQPRRRPARTLAEQRIELAGQQVPIPFRCWSTAT